MRGKKFQLNSIGIIIFLNQILIRFEDELKYIHLPIAYKQSALKYN